MKYKQIAFAKVGWAEFYDGDQVVGQHSYIKEYGEAHERYNFKPSSDGRYYGYVPPSGHTYSPPKPKNKKGWLVLFVARNRGKGKLTVVGWYENAIFEGKYLSRPEYGNNEEFELDIDGKEYVYTVHAENAFLIPVLERTYQIVGTHFRRAPIIYVRGNKIKEEEWRLKLAEIAENIVNKYKKFKNANKSSNRTFPDQALRKTIEEESVKVVQRYYKRKGFKVIDRQQDRCGYDLLVKKDSIEYYVEVKGTSGDIPHFYFTRNEMSYLDVEDPKWRLVIVTSVLDKPTIHKYSAKKVKNIFRFEAIGWEGIYKKKT
jgi:hypothetical protein